MIGRVFIAFVEILAVIVALTLIPILVGVLLIEVVVRGWKNTAVGLKIAAAAVVIALLMLMTVASSGAMAHDNPEDWGWIGKGRVKNEKGELCCGRGVDCKDWPISEIKITKDGYLFPNGQLIPANKVAPSADEFAHMCIWGGETKCTFYPMGGS